MIKTILVGLEGSSSDLSALDMALDVGRPFAAHLECLHVEPGGAELARRAAWPEFDEETLGAGDSFERLKRQARAAAQKAEASFEDFRKREDLPRADAPPGPERVNVHFRHARGRFADVFARQARYHDLLVLAGGNAAERQLASGDVGEIILKSGRPVLMAAAERPGSAIETVAIAWKNTPEAAHAVSAALPILGKAHRVIVLIANEENSAALECLDCSESVVHQLRWHGICADARYIIPGGRTAAQALLDTSREVGANLLVMGAYGHGRLAATVFGGVTREVLKGVDVPVLMCH
jgi:nucleotide-binding universal stress UspA family protein